MRYVSSEYRWELNKRDNLLGFDRKPGKEFGVSDVQARYICTGQTRWDITGMPQLRKSKYARQINLPTSPP